MVDEISRIVQFYRGKSVFITGGTGFMGKVLVEKLLRSCGELDTLYLMMRPKKGLSANERLEELFSSQIFSRVKEEIPNYKDKVKIIPGDLTEPDFGISQQNYDILSKNVAIVFHLAAIIRFDQTLRSVMNENVLPLKTLLALCRKMSKLQSVVFASTAYCNCDKSIVEEKVYPSVVTPEFISNCMVNLDDKILESIKKMLIKGHPNTYSFSKSIAENLLKDEGADLPFAIIRPSIVTNSRREPFPGWIDTYYGPSGLVVGSMKGVVRTQVIYQEKVLDVVPVDLAINMMIAISWYTSIKQGKEMLIYHCTSGDENPVTWGEIHQFFQPFVYDYPSETIFRYPHVSLKRNKFLHQIDIYLDHYLPAIIYDGISLLCGKQPRMVNVYKKVNNIVKYLEFYATQQWKFTTKNKYLLLEAMTSLDKRIFDFDVKSINWKTFVFDYALGTRRYLMKEPLSNVQKARRNLNRYLWINRAIKAFLVSGAGYLISLWAYAES